MMMILDFIFDYLFRENRYSVSTTASTVPVGELVGRIIRRDVRESEEKVRIETRYKDHME